MRRFVGLAKIHRTLDQLFLLHQENLLKGALRVAQQHLIHFEGELLRHMRFEEEELLPLYEARAGRIEGGPVELFLGEHRKMRLFVRKFKSILSRMIRRRAHSKREIIGLFDQQALFKHLMEHHDLREKNILYPALDRITMKREREELLR